jgi:hypothetical protein
MATTYTTTAGDTWDFIAYKTLGNEYLFVRFIEVNLAYRDVLLFDGGVVLNIPTVDVPPIGGQPPWVTINQIR